MYVYIVNLKESSTTIITKKSIKSAMAKENKNKIHV